MNVTNFAVFIEILRHINCFRKRRPYLRIIEDISREALKSNKNSKSNNGLTVEVLKYTDSKPWLRAGIPGDWKFNITARYKKSLWFCHNSSTSNIKSFRENHQLGIPYILHNIAMRKKPDRTIHVLNCYIKSFRIYYTGLDHREINEMCLKKTVF